MDIRVTSGFLRGRGLRSPRTELTHPMGAREKLALFNMLGDLTGVRVLDAYAGTGALGIEALSRGATEVVFVEKNPGVAKVLSENLRNLGLAEVSEVKVEAVQKFVDASTKSNSGEKAKFGVILADPPYDKFNVTEVAGLTKLLENDGILALSHPGDAPELPGLELVKSRKYARARISIYRHI